MNKLLLKLAIMGWIFASSVCGASSYLDSASLIFDDNKLVISSLGLGIMGTPSYPLHIQGAACFTGPVTFDLSVSNDAYAVNWALGNIQVVRVTQNGAFSISFSNPPAIPARLILVVQYTATLPGPLTFAQPADASIRFGYQVLNQEFFPSSASTDVFLFYWDPTTSTYFGRISSGAK